MTDAQRTSIAASATADAWHRRCSLHHKLGGPELRALFPSDGSEDEELIRRWTTNWDDLVEFEVVPVRTSADAAAAIAPQL